MSHALAVRCFPLAAAIGSARRVLLGKSLRESSAYPLTPPASTMRAPATVYQLAVVLLPAAASAFQMPWSGSGASAQREAHRQQFDQLVQSPTTCVLRVYARPNKSCQAGRDAAGQREATDPRPWHLLGRVAAESREITTIEAAIQAQRSLLEAEARLQHRTLRPHRTLVLAWADGGDEPAAAPPPTLGSFLCRRCNTLNEAAAMACRKEGCGAPRPEYAAQGELTLARRTSAAAGAHGFCSAAA